MLRLSGLLFVLAVTVTLCWFNPAKAQEVPAEESADERVVVDIPASEFSEETSLSFWAETQIGEFLARDEGCIRSRVLAYGWSGVESEQASGREIIVISDRFGFINLLVQRGPGLKDDDADAMSLIAEFNRSGWIIVGIKDAFFIITTIHWWSFLGSFDFWDDIYFDLGEIMNNIIGFVPSLSQFTAITIFAQPEGFTSIEKEDGQTCRFFFSR